ncbi:putative glycoside hydrolase family 71 protein [Lasiodiplodia theobromae]|uniref:Glycoside hydrolase family 71 n=1 Tax=Lasiodiplodia theobromae TaxID=45133 RepID=UPI0015C35445|nr:Glycoside hydrolase family 71 [Lasiodiplodia theobromae]KAF4541138.1 Glycoside hydrolase family 71 [Lasiodiplodia theobromae]KAF9632326.1 putative glycoside hydrolase family 71 protein [Lasiodiplodia theobromae]
MKFTALLALLIGAFAQLSSASLVTASFELLFAETYTVDTWKADIASAKAAGIDGFTLVAVPPNCQTRDLSWQTAKIKDAYTAAATLNFTLIPAFDMSYHFRTDNCPTGNAWNMTYQSTLISDASKQSPTYHWNDAVLVTTHGGSLYGDDYFSQMKSLLERQGINVSIAPYIETYVEAAHEHGDPEKQAQYAYSDYPSIDGFYNAMAWPLNVRENLTCDVDIALKDGLKNAGRKGPYITAVSPWYYKNLNTNSPADSLVQYSDTLWYDRWRSVIANAKPDIINIESWNSWDSSTYLRDVPEQNGIAPGCVDLGDPGNYVYGMNHTSWQTMGKHYAQYYKSGTEPEIKDNSLIYWYRVHRKDAECRGGQASATGCVQNSKFPDDSVFIWAAVRAHVEIEVFFGNSPKSQDMRPGSPKVTFSTVNQTGPQLLELPFPDDFPLNDTDVLYPHVMVYGASVHRIAYSKYDSVPITADCAWTNFNPVVQSLGPDFNQIIG